MQEEKKGKLPSGLVLQSFSFFSNISICISFLLLLMCSSSDYWELWVSGVLKTINNRSSKLFCFFMKIFCLFPDFFCRSPIVISETGRIALFKRHSCSVHANLTCDSSVSSVYVLSDSN